jgi:O-antigen/teichoic acid export membrane protein
VIALKTRFLASVVANAIRAGITFASGILIARGLSPVGYGELTFLLGSFVAIRALVDMGSSSAFYTFISRRPRRGRFYLFYFSWLVLQFAITLALVTFLMPSGLFEKIWLGQLRETVALAFVAVFMQQQVWQMVGQIGESARKTIKVQLLNITVAITYLVIVSLLFWLGDMSVQHVLLVTICLYGSAAILSYRLLRERKIRPAEEAGTYKQMLGEYWEYCKPMIWLAVAGFLYAFADKWMLQKFGGAAQQGYFQIASQFAQISLLATVSILNIFWKEIAEARARGDHGRVATLYTKINRGLVILSAVIAGLLIPWAKQIVAILLGPTYAQAWPVLAVMFLYPIHQSMGQIGGTMFMASGDTRKYVVLSISLMLCTLPVSYLVLAPTAGMLIPGLGLGAIGMAGYMVLTSVVTVNIQAWVIARHNGWQFDWHCQAVGIPLMITLGYAVKLFVGLVWEVDGVGWHELLVPVSVASFIYCGSAVLAVRALPWLIGMSEEELNKMFLQLRKGIRHVVA